jgi:broad specificity phosphatase PhoE
MCKELYVLRHGQSAWNAEGRHQGRLESRLTPLGRDQARAMGAVLAREIDDPSRFTALASPQLRAAETAELALAPLGLSPRHDPRLREVCLGAWQGLTDPEVFARWPESRVLRERDPISWCFTAPGGETEAQVAARMQSVLDELTGPTILVAHGVVLRVLRALYLGLDGAAMRALPGGQGAVWRLHNGVHEVLAPATGRKNTSAPPEPLDAPAWRF